MSRATVVLHLPLWAASSAHRMKAWQLRALARQQEALLRESGRAQCYTYVEVADNPTRPRGGDA